MGIPSYFVHIIKSHRNIIKDYNINKIHINNLYLDSNSLIYDAISEIKFINNNDFESKLLDAICAKLAAYINIIKPSNKVFIAFDGVAPVAKLSQQKNRRYKAWFTDEVLREIAKNEKNQEKEEHQENQENPELDVGRWNSASITPGTKFMDKLDIKINSYFKNAKDFNVDELIVSSSKKVGEGEHKIFDFIRDNSAYHATTSTAIYGLDSDLIMLTLNHLEYSDKLYLFRETPFFIKNIDSSLSANTYYLLDIPEFADKLAHEMTGQKDLTPEIKMRLVKDYVFMFFLLGNDFMPHFPALNIRTKGIDILLNIYNKNNAKLDCFLTSPAKTIIWKNLKKIIDYLSNNEDKLLADEFFIRDKWEKRKYNVDTQQEKFMNTPIFERTIERTMNPSEEGWEYRYYKQLFKLDINNDRLKLICVNYLTILEWNFKYYNSGCPDWRYKYNYNYPPLFKDLYKYIPYFDTNFLDTTKDKEGPISEYMQLAYVLPKNSLNLLPKNIENLLLKNYPDYYRLDYEFEWAFCKFFWESHVIWDQPTMTLLNLVV